MSLALTLLLNAVFEVHWVLACDGALLPTLGLAHPRCVLPVLGMGFVLGSGTSGSLGDFLTRFRRHSEVSSCEQALLGDSSIHLEARTESQVKRRASG